MDFPKRRRYNNNDIIGREKLPRISAKSDQQRQRERFELYEFVEQEVSGEGNCQFRSISDQIYGSCEHHKLVREQVVKQLKFCQEMSNCGEWGDNVTLQAAADSYGVKIFVITSFKDTDYIEILPQSDCDHKSNKMIYLSFCAELRYNSMYPQEEYPAGETYWWA
ncbi:OVARIAN TUMOR DOMAIN-containing deubiquitinating enzyme 9-like [Solanum stenotomum]|uniref:OVARIAN TUMOR DOMAIN-containing deubiquitinating enzyme 9-like n=1 Tax=Solanum stenotomum TaxID=172797 RepID=UPI0020D1C3C2|nr:OVARIAN TUMOR DOMAIN-containing deubiquitinating enzyme 9-like [Solanum stenotomum]